MGLVVDTADAAAFGCRPGCCGTTVSVLSSVIDLHMGRPLSQVFAVMAQAILSDLDGIKVALRTPLRGQRHTWGKRKKLSNKSL